MHRTAFIFAVVLSAVSFSPRPAVAQGFAPSSEGAAVGMARGMIAAMGGRQAWASARWLYVREEAHFSDRGRPVNAEYWRRFDEPGYWARQQSPESTRRGALTRAGAWRERDGVVSERTREEHQNMVGFWSRDVYTMYHRLAKEDSSLRLVRSSQGTNRFEVLDDTTGEGLCWFEVDGAGAVARWSARFGATSVEYVYGPLKDFGRIRMPAWGALVDGTFRFNYVAAELHADAPTPPFERPAGGKAGTEGRAAGRRVP